jgi:hypothetical protein
MGRGQLPSPPHSGGYPTPEPHREARAIIHPLYAHEDILGAGMPMAREDSNMPYNDHTQQAVVSIQK